MYTPKFTITNDILANIGLVEAAKEVIENAPLIPTYEAKFKKDALLRTVHHGTHIEGNDLTLSEVRKAIEGEEIIARERDVQEVINYRNVLKYIDGLKKEFSDKPRSNQKNYKQASFSQARNKSRRAQYNQRILKDINKLACDRIIIDDRAGKYRQTQVILKNSATGEITFRPPPAIEVSFLMEDFITWLNSAEAKKIHPVLRAGITHYYLVSVHPFIEANGRTARAFAILILLAEGYDIKKFFSLEDYFDKDAARYYQGLMDVDKQHRDLAKRDLTTWLEYFTQAMGVELTRIKEKVKRLSVDIKIKSRVGKQVPLNERQIKLIEYLEEHGAITTPEARKMAPSYSDDTLVRDFNYFIKKRIVKKQGKTKAARYVLR